MAEETGLIHPLGAFVLRMACEDASRWSVRGGIDLRIAVNVSSRQLGDSAFADLVTSTLRETGLDPHRLELEITESSVLQERGVTLATIQLLRELGVHVSIDDFGTGYSALSALKQLPVDGLKIDRSFVTDLPSDRAAATITGGLIGMANGLGLATIAEGVETREQMQLLYSQGCHRMQGYLFAKPMPGDELRRSARRRRCAVGGAASRRPPPLRGTGPAHSAIATALPCRHASLGANIAASRSGLRRRGAGLRSARRSVARPGPGAAGGGRGPDLRGAGSRDPGRRRRCALPPGPRIRLERISVPPDLRVQSVELKLKIGPLLRGAVEVADGARRGHPDDPRAPPRRHARARRRRADGGGSARRGPGDAPRASGHRGPRQRAHDRRSQGRVGRGDDARRRERAEAARASTSATRPTSRSPEAPARATRAAPSTVSGTIGPLSPEDPVAATGGHLRDRDPEPGPLADHPVPSGVVARARGFRRDERPRLAAPGRGRGHRGQAGFRARARCSPVLRDRVRRSQPLPGPHEREGRRPDVLGRPPRGGLRGPGPRARTRRARALRLRGETTHVLDAHLRSLRRLGAAHRQHHLRRAAALRPDGRGGGAGPQPLHRPRRRGRRRPRRAEAQRPGRAARPLDGPGQLARALGVPSRRRVGPHRDPGGNAARRRSGACHRQRSSGFTVGDRRRRPRAHAPPEPHGLGRRRRRLDPDRGPGPLDRSLRGDRQAGVSEATSPSTWRPL